jgi:hypothetical protein
MVDGYPAVDFTKEFTLGVNNPIADSMPLPLMSEEPDLYDELISFALSILKFVLNSSEYQMISSVHNSLWVMVWKNC